MGQYLLVIVFFCVKYKISGKMEGVMEKGLYYLLFLWWMFYENIKEKLLFIWFVMNRNEMNSILNQNYQILEDL